MKNLLVLAASAFMVASTCSAFADDLQDLKPACEQEIQNYCAGKADDEIEDCLQANMDNLSSACAEAVNQE